MVKQCLRRTRALARCVVAGAGSTLCFDLGTRGWGMAKGSPLFPEGGWWGKREARPAGRSPAPSPGRSAFLGERAGASSMDGDVCARVSTATY